MLTQELSTPVLTVDLDTVEKNLERLAGMCRRQGLNLRPHTKTHKTVEVARTQLAKGAVGLTVAKVGEAEVMAGAGFDDILVAFPIMGEEKLGGWPTSPARAGCWFRSIRKPRRRSFPAPLPRKVRRSA